MGAMGTYKTMNSAIMENRWRLIRQEGKRKLFHFLGVAYALLFAMCGRSLTLGVLGYGVGTVGIVELARLKIPSFNRWLLKIFSGIYRDHETRRFSGIFWTLAGCFLTAFFVPQRDIVLVAFLYLTVGDGLAGFVGRVWGRPGVGGKSWIGSAACFLGTCTVGLVFLQAPRPAVEVLGGAAFATVLERIKLPLDDNFSIPLFSGLALMCLRRFA